MKNDASLEEQLNAKLAEAVKVMGEVNILREKL